MEPPKWALCGCPLVGGSNHHNIVSTIVINFNRCHSQRPLCRGCPLVGGSIIGGSTVIILYS